MPVDFSFNPLADRKFQFYDQSLIKSIKRGDAMVHEFFRLLSLCHTVMPEEKNAGKLLKSLVIRDSKYLVSIALF